jgi:hypothetical protein
MRERSRWSAMTVNADFSSGGCAKFNREKRDWRTCKFVVADEPDRG